MHAGRIFSFISIIALFALTGCGESGTTPEETATNEVSASSTSSVQATMPEVGEAVEAPGVALTVDTISESDHLMLHADGVKRGVKPDERLDAPLGGRFVTVSTTVKNTGLDSWDLTCSFDLQTHVFNEQEQKFDPIDELDRLLDNPECNDSINPGFESAMKWSFAVPEDIEITHFGFADPETNYNDLTMINITGAASEMPMTSSPSATSTVADAPALIHQTTSQVPQSDPVPVDCQMGLGPIITSWSDGTVGGWSQYCQDVHDEVLAGEIAANTPVCDGVVCTYPSGATMPDPSTPQIPSDTSGAVCDEIQCVYPNGYIARIGDQNVPNYLKPGNSPWVQGQIDWQNCLDSGKTTEQCREELN